MDKVYYKTKKFKGVTISDTLCTRLKDNQVILVGSRMCMGCSYCYDVDREKQFVKCRKKINKSRADEGSEGK